MSDSIVEIYEDQKNWEHLVIVFADINSTMRINIGLVLATDSHGTSMFFYRFGHCAMISFIEIVTKDNLEQFLEKESYYPSIVSTLKKLPTLPGEDPAYYYEYQPGFKILL